MDERTALLERIRELESAAASRNAALARELEALQREREALQREQEALQHENQSLKALEASLRHQLEVLTRLYFGQRTERRKPTPEDFQQCHLAFLDTLEGAQRSAEAGGALAQSRIVVQGHVRARKGRRTQFPDHIPVLRTTFELREEERRCACGGHLEPMGEETSKELERIELSLVHELVRVKYSCRRCQSHVVTAPGPSRVIDRGILGVGFLAHVLTERFQNHMPYHRQEQKYASEGLSLSRSVLCTSARRCSELLAPIVEQLRREVLASDIVHTDDSPVTIQSDTGGNRRQGRIWIYRDLLGRCFFDFTEDRSRDGPARVLRDFRGYLVADAYPVYDAFFHPGGATEVACWAHARRRYVQAESSEPDLAAEALRRIGELYAVEKQARELEPDARRALRAAESRPRLDALADWLSETRRSVLDKGPMAQAIDYTLSNWGALLRFLEDGRLPIDNNAAERALRGVAVGRKNWMFVGNEEGGRTAAGMYSLIETCKAAEVNPREYLRDVLLRISTCGDAAQLTPHGWKVHFQAEVERRRHEALEKLFSAK